MADVKITVPLKDIQDSLLSRIKMLDELQVITKAAIQRGGPSTQHNEAELARMVTKMAKLQDSLKDLNDACCPNLMDCEHEIKD